jgi:hypothetical protein
MHSRPGSAWKEWSKSGLPNPERRSVCLEGSVVRHATWPGGVLCMTDVAATASLLTEGDDSELKKDSPREAAWASKSGSPRNLAWYSRRREMSRCDWMRGRVGRGGWDGAVPLWVSTGGRGGAAAMEAASGRQGLNRGGCRNPGCRAGRLREGFREGWVTRCNEWESNTELVFRYHLLFARRGGGDLFGLRCELHPNDFGFH